MSFFGSSIISACVIYFMSKEQIIEEAMKLDEKEREEVVEILLIKTGNGYSPEEIEKRWAEEAERRVDKILSGTAVLHDGEEVMERLRSRKK
jgi:hypothetical protein